MHRWLALTLFPVVLAASAAQSPTLAAHPPAPLAASAASDGKPPRPENPAILAAIHQAGRLVCGVVEPVDDWDGQGEHGDLSTLGTGFCEAVASAVLGTKAPVEILRFPAEAELLDAVKNRQVHLAVGLTPSAESALMASVSFGRPVFYDTQRFLVPRAAGFQTAAALKDNLVCAMNNSASEQRLRDYMTTRGIAYGLQAHSEQGEMDASVAVARCAAGAALETRLADSRSDFPAKAPSFVFLPERFGIAPVAPAFRYGDQAFGLLVDATVDALVEAEALGITRSNVEAARERTDMRAQRLLGGDRTVGQALGLPPDWAVHVIAAVGNYGEIFDRTLGRTYRLDRGLNALWTAGGLMHPAPLQ